MEEENAFFVCLRYVRHSSDVKIFSKKKKSLFHPFLHPANPHHSITVLITVMNFLGRFGLSNYFLILCFLLLWKLYNWRGTLPCMMRWFAVSSIFSRPSSVVNRPGAPLGGVGDEGVQHDWHRPQCTQHSWAGPLQPQPRRFLPACPTGRNPLEPPGTSSKVYGSLGVVLFCLLF